MMNNKQPNRPVGQKIIDALEGIIRNPDSCTTVKPQFNVKLLRKTLNLTQKEFSKRYHLSIHTLRNWEQGQRKPDLTIMAYLRCIAKNPTVINQLLNN